MGEMFGTDGVRGVANQDLTPELAFQLGRAGAHALAHQRGGGSTKAKVVIGRDTRVSGQMLEAAMVAGLTSAGADVIRLGIVPTPAVAYLTRRLGADAGVMISASHNPVPDNGIKFFTSDGFKLPDEVEDEIESLVVAMADRSPKSDGLPRPTGLAVGKVTDYAQATEDYVKKLMGTVQETLQGLRVVVDCANGAAFRAAPKVLTRLGAEVVAINTGSTGSDINVECGSTYPEVVQAAVREHRADVGIAHDGDADRVIAVDENGKIVNGDGIMAICALDMIDRGQLAKSTIAATVYSNLGLKAALEAEGGSVVVTKNGDRYVLEAMREHGLDLGGEQSGHIIFLRHNTTGDGILTAIQLLAVMSRTGQPLSALAEKMRPFPQVLQNVKVTDKAWETKPAVQAALAEAEAKLGSSGRIFVRASGTEPLIRVMGEAPDSQVVDQAVALVVNAVRDELGAER